MSWVMLFEEFTFGQVIFISKSSLTGVGFLEMKVKNSTYFSQILLIQDEPLEH